MADKKISQLTGASTPLAGTEVLPIVQNGSTVKVSIDNLTTGKVVPTGGVKVSGSAMSSATVGSVLEGSWPWQMYRDTESAQSTFVNYVDGGFWYVKSIPFADRNSAPSGVGTDQFSVRDDGNVKIETGNLIVGTADKGIQFPSALIWRTGTGTPEGAVTAPVGSLFTRTDGGANTTLYVKESGAGNTGWVAK